MIQLRPFDTLGAFRNEWLNAHHHFSFGGYHDTGRMGLGRLRVWNDDEVAPGTGFDPHPHRDMEIVTFIREGAITHRDNLGNEGRTEAGDVQVMHAGTGITHAEYNLEKVPTRLFQIWILPDRRGVAPGWSTRAFPRGNNGLSVLASGRLIRRVVRCIAAKRRRRRAGRHAGRGPDNGVFTRAGPRGLPRPGERGDHGEWHRCSGSRWRSDLGRTLDHDHRNNGDRSGRGRGCGIGRSLPPTLAAR